MCDETGGQSLSEDASWSKLSNFLLLGGVSSSENSGAASGQVGGRLPGRNLHPSHIHHGAPPGRTSHRLLCEFIP